MFMWFLMAFFAGYLMTNLLRHVKALLMRLLPTLLMRNLLTLSPWLLPTFLYIVAVFNRNLLAVLTMLNVLAHFLTLLALTQQLVQLFNDVALLFFLRGSIFRFFAFLLRNQIQQFSS